MDIETLLRYVNVIITHGGDSSTRIRLAQEVRKNVAQDAELLEKLGLTKKELDRFPKL